MAATTSDIAALIIQRKEQLDRMLKSDLIKLQVRYGDRPLTEALQIVDEHSLRQQLSVCGTKQRQQQRRADTRQIARSFQTK